MGSKRMLSWMTNWAAGIVGGITEYRKRPNWAKKMENVVLRPQGAMSVRKGSQKLSSATLTKKPHTVMEWVSAAGVGHIFAGCEDATNGHVYECKTGAFTEQTIPWKPAAAAKMVWDQLNGAIYVVEQGGSNPPMFYRASNPANTFHTSVLPRPAFPAIASGTAVSGAGIAGGTTVNGAVTAGSYSLTLSANGTADGNVTLTFGTAPYQFTVANCHVKNGVITVKYDGAAGAAATTSAPFKLTAVAGGNLTAATTYAYRLRYRFTDGSSVESSIVTVAMGANTQVQVTEMVNETRSDYIGWTLERIKAGGSTTIGPFYWVADGATTTTVAYNDILADADLGYRSDSNVHGEAPHLDGVIAFKDRLVGWEGSNIHFSQSIGDIEATGIADWNALNVIGVNPDDGDPIKAIVRQVDRLIVLKRWSVWVIEGDDIANYRVFPLPIGAGCDGPRAAAAIGSDVYFWGQAGFHRIRGNSVQPFGWTEVGHIFDTVKVAQSGDVVVKNYLNQYLLVFFASNALYNDDCLVWDQRFGAWTRFTGWYIGDAVVQKAGTFGDSQTMVTVDRRDFTGGGAGDYRVWMNFFGYRDEKAFDATGGLKPNVVIETPMIDDGDPNTEKDWEYVQLYLAGTQVSANILITLDPQRTSSVNVTADSTGTIWATGHLWGSFTWSSSIDTADAVPLPDGTFGRRYSLRLSSQPNTTFSFKGYVLRGILQPIDDFV